MPTLTSIITTVLNHTSSATLHIFSTCFARFQEGLESAEKLSAPMTHDPLMTARPEHRLLIELRFVLGGCPSTGEDDAESRSIKEKEVWIVRKRKGDGVKIWLEESKHGEDMNDACKSVRVGEVN
jgi:hypothetical protein